MFRRYIKTAARSLLRSKGFTIINITGLAFGLAACLLILFYITDEWSYDRYNKKASDIYRVNTDIKFGGNSSLYAISPPPLAAALTSNFPEVDKVARIIKATDISFKKGSTNVHEDNVVYADQEIFNVFTLPMINGSPINALSAPNSIVLTERAAKKYFNNVNVAGGYITLVNNSTRYKITGVIKNIPVQSHFNFDYVLSMPSLASSRDNNWNNFSFNTYVLLRPGVSYKSFEPKMNALIRQHFGEENYKRFTSSGNYIRLNLIPLTDIHLHSNRQYELGNNNSVTYVYIFSAIALFVLLIACINFINLSTARSANRALEVGVRKVLGSSRIHLIARFITESILVALMAALIALLAAWALLPLFNQISGKELTISVQLLKWLLPFLFVTVLLVGILAGSYPAFYLSGFKPIKVLKGKVATGFKGSLFRSILVVLQFSISIILITGSLVIYNQLNFIQHKSLGYNRNHVLVVKNVNVLDNAKPFKEAVKQIPGVTNATLSGFIPTGSLRAPDGVFKERIADSKNALFTEIWPVDADYVSTMGMSLLKGRNFSTDHATDSLGVIINQTAAKMLGYNNDPLNKKLYSPQDSGKRIKEYHIIGVLNDFNFSSLRDNITPVVMRLADDKGALSIRINTSDMAPYIKRIEAKWNAESPNQHFEYSFMDDDFDAAYRYEQRTGKIFLAFTMFAIFIACLGLFGLAAYAAEQRTREIGIRKVLGAGVSALVAMLTKDFLKLVVIAIIISMPIAWFTMNKWLQGFAYREEIHWWVLVTAGITAILIAFITISFQSFKAAGANPVKSLKSE